jgi:hypothetical protein
MCLSFSVFFDMSDSKKARGNSSHVFNKQIQICVFSISLIWAEQLSCLFCQYDLVSRVSDNE